MISADSVFGKWTSTVSIVLALAVALGLAMALITASLHPSDVIRVMVGTRDVIYCSRSATKADAIALGRALKEVGLFTDQGATAVLSKGRGGTVVSFAMSDGAWDLPDAISHFGEIGRRIAPSIGGFPFRVRLVDEKLKVHKDLAIGKENVGTRDTIYYYGSATSEEAAALGQSLRSVGAMQDVGATILLAKGDVTTISFIVTQTPWESPEVLATFESLMRRVAPSVGGLPVKLRFLDGGGVLHKEVSIL